MIKKMGIILGVSLVLGVTLVTLSFCTRLTRIQGTGNTYEVPLPFFSARERDAANQFLVFTMDEKQYFDGLLRKGWNHIEQLGNRGYFSNGTALIGIGRVKKSLFVYHFSISVVETPRAASGPEA